MSKNTGTSELINYFDLGANGDVGIAGSLDINTIANATTDTDTFLVSDTGIIKYRTGAQLLSDIGAQAAGNYVTTDTSQAITANKSFTVGFSLGSEGSGNQTSFFRNTSSLFSGSGGSNIFGFNNSNNIYFGKGLNNGGVLQWNNTTATRYYTLPDADGTLALTSQIPANPIGGTGTSGTIPVFTGSTTIGNSIVQSNATQVNIVGNGSQLLFDSLGSTKNGGIQYINDFTLQISNSRGTGSSINLGDINLDFNTNVSANPKLRITAGGNVLIGTTTDSGAKLEVAGGGVLSLLLSGNTTNATRKFAFIEGKHYTNSEEPIAMIGIDSQVSSSILYIGGGLTSSLNAATSISFQTAANNTTVTGTERMCITSVGQVGIGTSNPVRQFVISNGGADGIEFTQLVGTQSTEIITYNRSTSLYTPLQFESSLYTFSRGNLLVSANMGIGTNTINNERLTVAQTTGNASALFVYTTGVAAGQSYGATIVGGTNASDASFRVFNQGASINYFTVRGDGAATFSSSVTADAKIVSMQSNPALDAIIAAHNSANTGMEMRYFPNNAQGFIDNTYPVTAGQVYGDIYFRQNVSGTMNSRMFIQARSGNVGIGSTNPFARLQVTDSNTNEGTIAIGNNTFPGLIFSSAGTGEFRIDNRSSSGGGYISFYPNGQATTLGNEAMRVSTSRNLLIGTTTDTGARLNVGGSYEAYPVSIEAGSGGNQLSLTRGGAVAQFYMGGSTAGGTQFYVRAGGSGGVLLSAGSTGWVSASDIRLKDVTKPIQNAVESLSSLQTIYYSWKDSIDKSLHIGLIAQEVEKVFPELVSESSIDGMKGVNYTELIPVIIKAIQELNEKINK